MTNEAASLSRRRAPCRFAHAALLLCLGARSILPTCGSVREFGGGPPCDQPSHQCSDPQGRLEVVSKLQRLATHHIGLGSDLASAVDSGAARTSLAQKASPAALVSDGGRPELEPEKKWCSKRDGGSDRVGCAQGCLCPWLETCSTKDVVVLHSSSKPEKAGVCTLSVWIVAIVASLVAFTLGLTFVLVAACAGPAYNASLVAFQGSLVEHARTPFSGDEACVGPSNVLQNSQPPVRQHAWSIQVNGRDLNLDRDSEARNSPVTRAQTR